MVFLTSTRQASFGFYALSSFFAVVAFLQAENSHVPTDEISDHNNAVKENISVEINMRA